ncbi:alpha-1,3-mannosyl-glycoprotein 4-beta-N-acetylglucosaminyltransferase C-like [Pelobates fuscus]|uniref:alpha-1,3-mannosyl-glycoprotein 4-beta-N-acetylglucosaminyltransferase C-like n=1 Tax=Pelobates fuscus TaxID=191477 RepID=UPI002FE4A7DA
MLRCTVWRFLFAVLAVISVTVIITRKDLTETYCEKFDDPKSYFHIPQIQHKSPRPFDVNEDAMETLNIPYMYFLGSQPRAKRFFTIGISSVKRKKENYLLNTIHSIFNHSSPEELDQLLVVVYLANTKYTLNKKTSDELHLRFHTDIDAGRLIVISSLPNAYPTLEGLKRNYNDSPERVKFRSKQNIDYAFLVNFCANLSNYYIMLEDDVTCSKNFLTSIKGHVDAQKASWTTITFSNLGYIGKLYHNADLSKLARFLLLFYDEMPCDWLLDLFFKSKAQKEILRAKPSLFQHMGMFSSFQSNRNNLKDIDFVEVYEKYGDNPSASCFTNMESYLENQAENVCYPGPSFFWGKNVKKGDYFTMIFQDTVNIEIIHVLTGSPDHPGDILQTGFLELGSGKTKDKGGESCKVFRKIGEFINGEVLVKMEKDDKSDCLRIYVSASQNQWLIIQKVGIWLKKR